MNPIDENLESRIVRSLDGELSDDEQLLLDRELIRDPDAHRMRDDYEGVDRLAASALCSYVEAPIVLAPEFADRSRVRRRSWSPWSRGLLAVSGAIAAALLAIVIPAPMRDERPIRNMPVETRQAELPYPSSMIQPVSSTPVLHRATGRELIGVVGEDGNLYWIEVERVRTLRLPNGRLGLKGNEL